jgi:hypothetical protein
MASHEQKAAGRNRQNPDARKPDKVLLVDRAQHLDDRSLDDLVLQRRDPERSFPTVGLGDEHSA